jgi:DNA invertase Pin-like site-specific DNA recombinase
VQHLTTLAAELAALGVDLVVLDQGLDASTPTGRLTFHVLAALAEFERDLIRERTRDGLRAARRRGSALGRPRALDERQAERARRLRLSGRSVREIAAMLEVSKSAVHRVVAC